MNTRRLRGFILCFLTILCGSAQAAPLDPCTLLTKQEAETLTGEAITGPELKDSHNPLGQRMCLYTTGTTSRLIQVSVIRTADMAPKVLKHGQSAAKVYQGTKEMLVPMEKVSGIGDDACWGTPGLHILKGETYVLISVGNTNKRENLDLARRIADKVLRRL